MTEHRTLAKKKRIALYQYHYPESGLLAILSLHQVSSPFTIERTYQRGNRV